MPVAGNGLEESGEDADDDEAFEDSEDDDVVAKPGEQVAAKVTLVDENGSWILASVLHYNRRATTYQVQDEDDASKLIELPASRIRRLYDDRDSTTHDLQKGDRVLAIFPETTSFYRAVISKSPKRNASGHIYEVVLKFEDDEDDAGRTPHRRVNIRYVLREHYPAPLSRSERHAFIPSTHPSVSQAVRDVTSLRTERQPHQPATAHHESHEVRLTSGAHEERANDMPHFLAAKK